MAYQEYSGPEMTPEFAAACEKDLHVLCTDGTVLRGGPSMIFIFGKLGWSRSARISSLPPFVWIVNVAYWVVSRNRRVFSRILFTKTHPTDSPQPDGQD